jgi:hypothetical protein
MLNIPATFALDGSLAVYRTYRIRNPIELVTLRTVSALLC